MSYKLDKVIAEFSQGSWAFVDRMNPSNRVKFDQALIDAVYISPTRIEGYARSVHGIDQEVAQHLDSATRSALGVTAANRLGRVGTMTRVRLMPDGSVEKEAYT